jgi:hypothetical protein
MVPAVRNLLREHPHPHPQTWTPVTDLARALAVQPEALMPALTERRDGLGLPVFGWRDGAYIACQGAAVDRGGIAVHADVVEAVAEYFAAAEGLLKAMRGSDDWAAAADVEVLARVSSVEGRGSSGRWGSPGSRGFPAKRPGGQRCWSSTAWGGRGRRMGAKWMWRRRSSARARVRLAE